MFWVKPGNSFSQLIIYLFLSGDLSTSKKANCDINVPAIGLVSINHSTTGFGIPSTIHWNSASSCTPIITSAGALFTQYGLAAKKPRKINTKYGLAAKKPRILYNITADIIELH